LKENAMEIVKDVAATAVKINAVIDEFNAWRKERLAAGRLIENEIKAKRDELLQKCQSIEASVALRLHNIEDEVFVLEDAERAWVSKHPLAAFVLVLIGFGLALWVGIAIGHHGCRVLP